MRESTFVHRMDTRPTLPRGQALRGYDNFKTLAADEFEGDVAP